MFADNRQLVPGGTVIAQIKCGPENLNVIAVHLM